MLRAKPSELLSSSTAPYASTRRSALETRVPPISPVCPLSPWVVAMLIVSSSSAHLPAKTGFAVVWWTTEQYVFVCCHASSSEIPRTFVRIVRRTPACVTTAIERLHLTASAESCFTWLRTRRSNSRKTSPPGVGRSGYSATHRREYVGSFRSISSHVRPSHRPKLISRKPAEAWHSTANISAIALAVLWARTRSLV